MPHDIDAHNGEPIEGQDRYTPAHEEGDVSRDVAEAEFERFCDEMDLDPNPEGLNEDDRKAFERERATIIEAVENRTLEFDADTAEPIFYPRKLKGVDKIRFREPTGASFQAMDAKGKGHDMARLYALMADISGQPAKTFAKMKNRDLKVCRALILVFMG